MAQQLFDYEALFGVELAISKADRARLHAGTSNHAMVLMGVDLDCGGRPRKWLVENSWGEDKGDEGSWTLCDRWFDEHVYTIIMHKRHVPEEVLQRFEEDPIELPAWYPGARGIG
jgi:bleomycin hydrolase